MPGVRPRGDEPIDRMLKAFKKQLEKSGVLQEVRDRQHYLKPSVRKREKSAAARQRMKKLRRKMGLD